MNKTAIEYLTHTWSPVTGCTPVSEGCANCWARAMHKRKLWGDRPFSEVTLHPDRIVQPLKHKKPARIGVCFMGDLFHDAVPDEFIIKVFVIMESCPQHTFQILTKRSERMFRLLNHSGFPDVVRKFGYDWLGPSRYQERGPHWRNNVHLGTSISNQEDADRNIPFLFQTPAAVRVVSYEPALAPVQLQQPWADDPIIPGSRRDSLREIASFDSMGISGRPRIDWLICGGESGPKARQCNIDWIRSMVQQCKAAGVPVFVKQLGAQPVGRAPLPEPIRNLWHAEDNQYHYAGFSRKGDRVEQWPEDLRVREFPGDAGVSGCATAKARTTANTGSAR